MNKLITNYVFMYLFIIIFCFTISVIMSSLKYSDYHCGKYLQNKLQRMFSSMHEHLLQVEETLYSQVQSVLAKVNLANENAT